MLLEKELTENIVEGFISMVVDYIVESFTAPFEYIRLWNIWRKRSVNSKTHKFLVLIGVVTSPTFELSRRWEKEG